MKILALDTATEACSAALLLNDQLIERHVLAPRGHADLILSMVDEVLAEAGVQLNQLDAVAFDRGPGSFTGVRIGTSVAQGLAFGADLPVAPVSSLMALAQAVFRDSGQTEILAVIDARMGEVYWAAYHCYDDNIVIIAEEQVAPAEQVVVPSGHWFGVGSGWQNYTTRLPQMTDGGIDPDRYPHARDIAMLGRQIIRDGLLVSADDAIPVYLRNKVAWAKV